MNGTDEGVSGYTISIGFHGLIGDQQTLGFWAFTIIPTEIRMPTIRTEIPGKTNTEAITKDLDMADELREAAAIRIASYQQRLTNLYNMSVRLRTF